MSIGTRLLGATVCALLATSASGGGVAQAERVVPVPLGGILGGQFGDRSYGVYVPTRHGGILTVKGGRRHGRGAHRPRRAAPRATARRSAGRTRTAGTRSASRAPTPDKPYAIETTFVQVGQAARMPWNFYYWPTKGDSIHEPWAGGNGRVDTPGPAGDDIKVAPYGAAIAPGQDIILPGANGLLETPTGPGRHLDLVPQPLRRPDLPRRRRHPVPDPVAAAEVRPALRALGPELGGGQQPEPGHPALAGALPRGRRRFDHAERAAPGARHGHVAGRTEGALGGAGREPPQPPDRRQRQQHPARARRGPASTRATRTCRGSTPMLERHIRARRAGPAGEPAGVPADRQAGRGLEPRRRQVYGQAPRHPRRRASAGCASSWSSSRNTGSNLNEQDPKPRINSLRVRAGLRARTARSTRRPAAPATGSPRAATRCTPR